MKQTLITFFLLVFFVTTHNVCGESQAPAGSSGGSRSSSSGGGKALPFLYFGGLVGIAYPPSSIGATSRLNLGGTFQFRISKNLGIGIYYMQALKQESTGYVFPYDKHLIKVVAYGGEINYWFRLDSFAFRIGYRMGPSVVSVDAISVIPGTETHPTHFGPVLSTDFFLGKDVSVGVEGVFLFFGDIIENSPFVTYYLNSSLKLWF